MPQSLQQAEQLGTSLTTLTADLREFKASSQAIREQVRQSSQELLETGARFHSLRGLAQELAQNLSALHSAMEVSSALHTKVAESAQALDDIRQEVQEHLHSSVSRLDGEVRFLAMNAALETSRKQRVRNLGHIAEVTSTLSAVSEQMLLSLSEWVTQGASQLNGWRERFTTLRQVEDHASLYHPEGLIRIKTDVLLLRDGVSWASRVLRGQEQEVLHFTELAAEACALRPLDRFREAQRLTLVAPESQNAEQLETETTHLLQQELGRQRDLILRARGLGLELEQEFQSMSAVTEQTRKHLDDEIKRLTQSLVVLSHMATSAQASHEHLRTLLHDLGALIQHAWRMEGELEEWLQACVQTELLSAHSGSADTLDDEERQAVLNLIQEARQLAGNASSVAGQVQEQLRHFRLELRGQSLELEHLLDREQHQLENLNYCRETLELVLADAHSVLESVRQDRNRLSEVQQSLRSESERLSSTEQQLTQLRDQVS